jgi:plasmid stability protein
MMSAELAGKAYVEMSVKGREEFAKAFSDMQSSVQTFAARLNAVRAAPNGTAMQKFFKSAKKEFGDLIGIAKQYGAVIGVAIGAGTVAMLTQAISKASDLQETMNKFRVVFGDNASQMEAWGTTFAAQVGRSKQEVLDFMSQAQGLVVPMGIDPNQAQMMSQTLTQLSFDLASFHNSTDAEAFEALRSALTGEAEPMKKFGVIVNETAVKAELLKRGLDPTTANEAQKAMARYNIILEGTKQAQGDVERSGDSFANRLKALQASWDDLSAGIGTAFLPVAEALLGWFTELIQSLGDASGATDATGDAFASMGGALGIAETAAGYLIKAWDLVNIALNTVMGTGRMLMRVLLNLFKLMINNPLARGTFGKETIDNLVTIVDEVDKVTAKLMDENSQAIRSSRDSLLDPKTGEKAVANVQDFIKDQQKKYADKREKLKAAREQVKADSEKADQEAKAAAASLDGQMGEAGSEMADGLAKAREEAAKRWAKTDTGFAFSDMKPIENLATAAPPEKPPEEDKGPTAEELAAKAQEEMAQKAVELASPQTLESTSLAAFERFRENAQNEQKQLMEKQLAVQSRMAAALQNPKITVVEVG